MKKRVRICFVLLYSSNNKKRRKSDPIKMSKSTNQLSHTLIIQLVRNSALYYTNSYYHFSLLAMVYVAADSSITGPMRLRSYYAVACYSDSKTKFSFAEGAVLQVLQKDPSGEPSTPSTTTYLPFV